MESSITTPWDEDDDRDQQEAQFLRMRATRDLKESLVSQISSDRAACVEVKDIERPSDSSSSSTKEVLVYNHNITTM